MQSRPVTPALDGYAPGVNLLDGYTVTGSFNSQAIPIRRDTGFSVIIKCPATGSPNGTFKLQVCNDETRNRNELTPDSNLTNWVDLPSGGDRIVTGAIANASTIYLSDPQATAKWFRLVYTASSGSITVTAIGHIKGDR